jgi:DNA repair protein RadA/Sms
MKVKTIFSCQHCGSQYSKWQGQCAECQKWNTIVEEANTSEIKQKVVGYAGVESRLTALPDVELQTIARIGTGMAELDHVLGGGLVSDSVVLIGGDPGVGKSTLLLQILCQLAKNYKPLYVTGEESLQQVAMRAKRLNLAAENLTLLAETNVESIIKHAEKHQPNVMVIDSVQTIFTERVQSAPGGVGQVRESCSQLVRFAKQKGIALFFIGHVTKEGSIAGPRVLEHMVDSVLYFEGERDGRYRLLRAVKNRFGAVNELGVFAMTDEGLKQISNPSALFLSGFRAKAPGSSIMVTWEGSRPLLVEIQALVDESHLPNPRRVTVGLDQNRLSMLLAVLNRHGAVSTYDQDVFVNAVGGLRVRETAADLSILMAVLSSLKNQPLQEGLVVFGEVGLSGEVRPVPSGQERLKEAQKHGFKTVILPKGNMPKKPVEGLQLIGVEHLQAALSQL